MGDKRKTSLRFANPADVASFIRMIADQVEGIETDTETMSMPSIQDFEKIDLEIKREEAGAFRLKMKAKLPGVEEEVDEEDVEVEAEEPKADFKTLRKRMDKAFKDIKQALYKDTLPVELSVNTFLQDSEYLVDNDEGGNDFYPAFKDACTEFESAFEQKDVPALIGVFARIKTIKDTQKLF